MHRPNRVAPPEHARKAQERHVKDPETGCWNTTYAPGPKGYSTITWQENRTARSVPVHRASWNHSYGQIPAGMVVDHTCFNRRCVNPAHLRLLTLGQNSQRRHGRDFPIGQCANGHPETAIRDFKWSEGARRVCGECMREKNEYVTNLRKYIRLLEITYGLGDWHTKRSYAAALREREARVEARRAERERTVAA